MQLAAEVLLCGGYSALFIWALHGWKALHLPSLSPRFLSLAFVAKLGAGLALNAVYTYYYTDRSLADVYRYFDDSAVLFGALSAEPGDFFRMLVGWETDTPYFRETYYDVMNSWIREFEGDTYNDAHTMIRLNAVFRFFSFGYLSVHTVFINVLSMLGLMTLYRALAPFLADRTRLLSLAVFAVPSVLFWGSGVLKEGLLLLALGIQTWAFCQVIQRGLSAARLFHLLWSAGLFLILKFYILVALIPGMLAWLWYRSVPTGKAWWRFGLILGGFAVLGFCLPLLWPEFPLLQIMARKQNDFLNLVAAEGSGSLLYLPRLEPTALSFLKLVPLALVNALARPLPFESFSPFILVAGLENGAFFLLGLLAVLSARSWSRLHAPFAWFLLTYVFILAVLIGWITPVMGAIVRYKVPVLPFLAALLVGLMDRATLAAIFPSVRWQAVFTNRRW